MLKSSTGICPGYKIHPCILPYGLQCACKIAPDDFVQQALGFFDAQVLQVFDQGGAGDD